MDEKIEKIDTQFDDPPLGHFFAQEPRLPVVLVSQDLV
jgi:hypothetical protein